MEVMGLVLPLALAFVAVAVLVFAWAVRSGQFDDLVTPGMRILSEEDEGPDQDVPAASDAVTPRQGRSGGNDAEKSIGTGS